MIFRREARVGAKIALGLPNTCLMRAIFTRFLLGRFFYGFAQYPNSPIMGWKMQESNDHVSFAPAMLVGAANFHYDVYPPDDRTEKKYKRK